MKRESVKLLALGDLHWQGSNPRAYVGSYIDDMTAILREVVELAKDCHASAVLQAGDMFGSPTVGFGPYNALIPLIDNLGRPFITVPGNHDLFGANVETLRRTPLGAFLDYRGDWSRDVLQRSESYELEEESVVVFGTEYSPDVDTRPRAYGIDETALWLGDGERPVLIHIVHGMALATPPPMEGMRWTDIHEAETNADIVITGHDHTGYGIQQIGKTLWVNPGALCRLSATETEMSRTIQAALITIDWPEFGSKPLITASLIPLNNARPGHECLSREHIEQNDWRDERTSDFLRELAGGDDGGGAGNLRTPQEMVDYIAEREGLPEDVRAEALRRIGVVEQELAAAERGR